MGKWTDFARTEIYAFHRMTATLTTFFLAAGAAVLAIKGGLECPLVLWSFAGLLVVGLANILIIWARMKRTIFQYYAKLDKSADEREQAIRTGIAKNEGKWHKAIAVTFIFCFAAFFVFVVVVLFFS